MTMPERTDEELVRAYKDGSSEAVELLLNRYKRTVRCIARAKFLIGGDEEDLIQEGMIGLYKAIRDYRPHHNTSFHTFARLCINRQILKVIEASNSQKNRPLNEFVSLSGEEWEEQLERFRESPESILIEAEKEREILEKIQSALSPLERKVLNLYLNGLDYREIAAKLNRTPKSIDNALQRIRKKASSSIHA